MSRYDDVETGTVDVTSSEGGQRRLRYYRRRFPSDPSAMTTLATHVVEPADRLDLLSYRYLGDPLAFWRICDANTALDPDDLVNAEAVGIQIVVPMPGSAIR
jgi:hypothetical protein